MESAYYHSDNDMKSPIGIFLAEKGLVRTCIPAAFD